MKKTGAAALALAVVVAIAALLAGRPVLLGNMHGDVKEAKTSCTTVSFFAHKGDQLKLSLASSVQSGTLGFVLTDSGDNEIASFDPAKASETTVDVSADDTYTLSARYEAFTGKFDAKVSKKR